MKRSNAATTAAASSAEAVGATIVSFGRRFIGLTSVSCASVPSLPVLDHDTVLAAVSARTAIDRVRDGLLRFQAGEWVMPSKVYLESPPFGDFRAMPARGARFALLKWVTSFPGNPALGLPTVTGVICLSNAENGEPLMLMDARSVTALRTGAVAAVATEALARADARTVGIIGCGLHGAWAARCLVAQGTAPACVTTRAPTSPTCLRASWNGAPGRAPRRSAATSSAASLRAARSWSMSEAYERACT